MAQDYDYGQLLDDFELGADVMPGEELTDYIERRRREFESKADGGIIGIEVKIADEMAKGGRVGLFSGGALKGLANLFKGGKDKIDDIIETKATEKIGFRSRDDIPLSTYSEMKGPIKISEMENIPEDQLKKILRTQELGLYEETPEILKAANLLERFTKKVGGKRVIDYERAEDILNVKLKGNETLDELFKIEFKTRPENRLTDSPFKDFEEYVLKGENKADGGRVGLFMGGPALEGQALNIYNSMSGYGFTDQQIANALQGQGLYTPSGSSTPETTASNIIGSQLNQGGGGDNNFGGQGIGAFGNLDPNTLQTMQVEVADGKGGVTIKEVDTYLDAGGMRKTLDNKNPVNLGLDIKPMAVTIMESLMGKKNDLEFDPAGKILGPFNNPNYKDLSFFGKIKADASRQKELKQLQKEFELQEKLKKEIAAQEAQYGKINYGRGSDGKQSYDSGLGFGINATTGGPVSNRTGRGRDDYSKGGLATMFTRRR